MSMITYRLRRHSLAWITLATGLALFALVGTWRFFSGDVTSLNEVSINVIASPASIATDETTEIALEFNGAVREAVSGADIVLTLPPALTLVSHTGALSVFDQEAIPFTVGTGGTANFSRIRFDDGYTGTGGHIYRFTVRGTTAGTWTVGVDVPNSEVLSYSGIENLLTQAYPAQITVTGPSAPASSSAASAASSLMASSLSSGSPASSAQASSAPVSSTASSVSSAASVASSVASVSSAPASSASSSMSSADPASSASSTETASSQAPSGGGGGGGGGGNARQPMARSSARSSNSSSSLHGAADAPTILCDALNAVTGYRSGNTSLPLTKVVDGFLIAFQDVPRNAWFAPYVNFLVDAKIAGGYRTPDGRLTGFFGPGNSVTHGEITKMVLMAVDPTLDLGTLSSEHLRNSGAVGQWFAPYFAEAERRQWSLHASGMLEGNRSATRGEVARMIVDGYGWSTTPYVSRTFTDLSKLHVYYKDIQILAGLQILKGDDGKTTIRPNAPINRAEVGAMLARALESQCK